MAILCKPPPPSFLLPCYPSMSSDLFSIVKLHKNNLIIIKYMFVLFNSTLFTHLHIAYIVQRKMATTISCVLSFRHLRQCKLCPVFAQFSVPCRYLLWRSGCYLLPFLPHSRYIIAKMLIKQYCNRCRVLKIYKFGR